MILTDEEIAFFDVVWHEGTEPPFGGPATEVMTRIGIRTRRPSLHGKLGNQENGTAPDEEMTPERVASP